MMKNNNVQLQTLTADLIEPMTFSNFLGTVNIQRAFHGKLNLAVKMASKKLNLSVVLSDFIHCTKSIGQFNTTNTFPPQRSTQRFAHRYDAKSL